MRTRGCTCASSFTHFTVGVSFRSESGDPQTKCVQQVADMNKHVRAQQVDSSMTAPIPHITAPQERQNARCFMRTSPLKQLLKLQVHGAYACCGHPPDTCKPSIGTCIHKHVCEVRGGASDMDNCPCERTADSVVSDWKRKKQQ